MQQIITKLRIAREKKKKNLSEKVCTNNTTNVYRRKRVIVQLTIIKRSKSPPRGINVQFIKKN